MTADDLSAPLGRNAPRKRRFRLPFTAAQAVAALAGLFLLAFLGFALFNDNPLGGEPIARVAIRAPTLDDNTASAPPTPAASKPAAPIASAAPEGQRTITIIDGSSGARQNVVVAGESDAKASAAAAASDAGAAAQPTAMADPRLLEKSRYGMIPIAAEGMKPFSAYAASTEAERARAAKLPVIAIVVTGLGVGATRTADAIIKLPAAVTLAFTPYGSEPMKLVERARGARHEVLLQLPMEPFDYPDNDPGPQTLMTTLAPEQNLDRLFWHMSRIQGYVGVANFMGGRLVTDEAAMQPIIREAGKRGLGYLDDGQAPRSVAGTLALSQAMPYARADLVIDASPTGAEIDKALARLEAVARERGVAIGIASSLPAAVERIAAWSKSLESRGVLLAPLTTAMLKSKSS